MRTRDHLLSLHLTAAPVSWALSPLSGDTADRKTFVKERQWCAFSGIVPSSGQAASKAASITFSAGGSR